MSAERERVLTAIRAVGNERTMLATALSEATRELEAADGAANRGRHLSALHMYSRAAGQLADAIRDALNATARIETLLCHVATSPRVLETVFTQAHEREKLRDAGRLK
jgi:hypothetical protein